jgi:hypothetical protein
MDGMESVRFDVDDAVCTITLDRPERRTPSTG